MSNVQGRRRSVQGTRDRCPVLALLLVPLALLLGATSGCTWDRWNLFTPPEAPPAPDSFVLGADGLQAVSKTELTEAEKQLAGAHVVFRQGDYGKAEKIFHHLAGNTKNTIQVAEEARYYEAECLRLENHWPKAVQTYHKMLMDFPSGVYREQAMQHMFEIANKWLDDTREEMREVREKHEGKRTFVWPDLIHFEKEKPTFDEEGRALEVLTQVRYSDMTGPLADKALFLSGAVHFFNEDYKEADQDFTQLLELHPNSQFAVQAIELGIISKHLSTGGSDYDGRKVAEARQLVHTALNNYPELRAKKNEFLTRQLMGITYQQAEKDFKTAEFYRRTGHEKSAYFCYEVVRMRYPNTKFFDLATEHMHEIKAKAEKEGNKDKLPPIEGPGEQAGRLEPVRPGEQIFAPPAETAPAPRVLTLPETAPTPRPVPMLPPSSLGLPTP